MWRGVIFAFSLGLLGVCASMFYGQFYQWRSCFNDLGRCFDPETGVVYQAQSGVVWLMLTVLVFAGVLYQVWKWCRAEE